MDCTVGGPRQGNQGGKCMQSFVRVKIRIVVQEEVFFMSKITLRLLLSSPVALSLRWRQWADMSEVCVADTGVPTSCSAAVRYLYYQLSFAIYADQCSVLYSQNQAHCTLLLRTDNISLCRAVFASV